MIYLPMIFVGCLALVPIILNDAKNMVQYLSAKPHRLYIFWDGDFSIRFGLRRLSSRRPADRCLHRPHHRIFGPSESRNRPSLFGDNKLVGNITPAADPGRINRGDPHQHFACLRNPPLAYPTRSPYLLDHAWASSRPSWDLLGDLILSVIRRDIGVRDTGFFHYRPRRIS